MNSLEKYSNFINDTWHDYIHKMSRDGTHTFLKQIKYLNEINKNQNKIDDKLLKKIVKLKKYNYLKIKYKRTNFIYENIFKEIKCEIISDKVILEKYIYDVYDYLSNSNNLNIKILQKKLDKFDSFLLTSPINIKDHLKNFKNKSSTDINVLILGGGPSGMYIMNKLYFNNWIGRKVNIILIEQRIKEENKRKPFTRFYTFGFNPDLINSLFPKISCLNIGALRIKYLEIILYVYGYCNKLPFYFTRDFANQEQINLFIRKYKIDALFDATGGRFANNYFSNTPNYFKNLNLINDTNEIKIDVNKAEVTWINNSIKNKYFVHFDYTDKINKDLKNYFDKYQEINKTSDLDIIKLLNNKCLKIKDKTAFIDSFLINIKNKILKYHFLNLLKKDKKVKINLIETKMYHLLNISTLINKNRTVYIGAGDTIYSGHFILGAGLNRTYVMMDMIINMIQSI